ncbi:Cyclin, N-terminal domain family protein [Candida parapsilosis]|uniref:Cyclin N-terminal domain-containing protein n=2 Tax=Candida parapsilosis TaxID=5480 RepID=G8BHW0_CANPC|nr:uncharacterized protein CPAR2_400250 [Candida parapsilosis]KAF6046919.1 Cyclin, N-terminal domain family protein [Candida parapsilosis]KAF6047314.1 Cyclin, N-terminal domain family protein [Candida parapsilosis]KAF6050715.1 Cyclin, N-terminal domain family protein [Candida parapsilosis]KAF6061834.1 Cyclin, N-terminal domain family protein [Candida parapsilosis]KAI5905734.1 hypothetical protein K4G60_g5004 [Candida parapsilosis]
MLKNSDSYTEGYIKLAWIIISTSPSTHSMAPSQLARMYHQYDAKYSNFIRNLIANSQLAPTNLVISLYYLYKHYHQNNMLVTKLEQGEDSIDPLHLHLIITSLILSNKSYDDQSYTLKTWSIIINNTCKDYVDVKLLNTMESYFLSSLDFKLSFIGMSSDGYFWSLFEKIGGIDYLTLSTFKSLAIDDYNYYYNNNNQNTPPPIKTQSYTPPPSPPWSYDSYYDNISMNYSQLQPQQPGYYFQQKPVYNLMNAYAPTQLYY